ncbi:MAG: HlyD family type I secretion periplasmic adaptor subunit [Pseudomonadota bacterium]
MTHTKDIMKPMADTTIRRMTLFCVIGLGGFLAWAIFAPLEEGIAAQGRIVVDNDRKVVQHFEGGIIDDIRVREGDRVEAGDTLLVLKDTVSLAGRDQVIQDYAASLASAERLRTLASNGEAPNFTALDNLALGDAERSDIIDRESALFRQQREALYADLAVLRARRDSAIQTQQQRADQEKIAQRAFAAARKELESVQNLFAQKLARSAQVSAAERQSATLEADVARFRSERETAVAQERDVDAQIAQTRARFSQQIASELRETRATLLSVEERLNAAQDVLDRSIITAPVSGEVLNLHVATVSGVIRSGETIMEIVPDVAEVTASIRIRPVDRASIFEGQLVRTQIAAYQGWQAPRLEGRVIDVSADLKEDPATGAVYYEARIRVPREELESLSAVEITPGMPVDAFVFSGRSRTLADYLLAPLGESLFKGLRSS